MSVSCASAAKSIAFHLCLFTRTRYYRVYATRSNIIRSKKGEHACPEFDPLPSFKIDPTAIRFPSEDMATDQPA
jgi:hypothetical protein